MQIKIAEEQFEIEKCFIVMNQLRENLDIKDFYKRYKDQEKENFKIAYLSVNYEVVSLAGFRIGNCFAWGKFLYINDLITEINSRGKGYGGKMIDWLVTYAKSNNCQQIHLDSGVQRHEAHEFYFGKGFKISSHHFSMNLNI